MIRVLYVNGNILKRGGIESFMMNYYREFDKERIHVDFIVHGYEKGIYDDEILENGSIIYHVPTKSKHPIKYGRMLRKILTENHYDVIHSHLDAMSGWVLKIAKECGVPIRIAHSHNTDHLTTNKLKIIVNEYAKRQIPKSATHMLACSTEAGKWLFGTNEFKIAKNAILVEKFVFDSTVRNQVREEWKIEDNSVVLGHVGRFDYQKNQEFLLAVLKGLLAKGINAKLVFVGAGYEETGFLSLVQNEKLSEYVHFCGSRSDVDRLYNGFDIFVLPSRFEGLGIVAVEAQVNGLPCILSNQIPKVVKIGQNVSFCALETELWVNAISQLKKKRHNNIAAVKKAGYDIQEQAEWLTQYYESLVKHVN